MVILKKNLPQTLFYFLIALLICLGGGWLTGIVTQQGIKSWYPALIKPKGTPPNLTFPIVWSLLYCLMAWALTLLWLSPKPKKRALFLFAIQLTLNFSWSLLFFYFQSPFVALIDLSLLWFFIFLTFFALRRHSLLASYLFLPYFAWVSYAFYLNLFIWLKN